ncbi:MAG: NAD+ synthase [Planctomycetota bacterium]
MGRLRVALAQINATVGDLGGNSRKIIEATASGGNVGADIVTFPELAVCGYPPEDLLLKPRFLRDCRDALEAIARETKPVTVVVGFPDFDDDGAYNAAAVIQNGRVAHVYHKIELPNYGVFDEERYFGTGAGAHAVVFGAKGVPVGVNICEDVWHEGGLAEWHAKEHGVRVVLNLSASPFHLGKLADRRETIARFARQTGAVVCYTNLVGGQDELVFDGGSLVVGPQGELLARANRFDEDLLVADIDLGSPAGAHPAGRILPELGETEEMFEALVLGTRDYARKNGFAKVALGMSGGVDSSLTAAIAVHALGEDNVVGVNMPSKYSSRQTRSDAALVAANLGIPLLTVPINSIFQTYLDVLDEPLGPGEPGTEAENLQARARANILMALSNRFGWLVLTTGNKSETAVGYCTLYGDMAGGFGVIKDVTKMRVYKLANYVNQRAGRPVIPQSVLDRAPTAELKPCQKDTDSLPPYPVLDRILQMYVEEDAAPDDIVAAGFSRQVVDRVVSMVDHNEFKRRQAAPGVRITPKAFGRDRRLPITNRYGQVLGARGGPS